MSEDQENPSEPPTNPRRGSGPRDRTKHAPERPLSRPRGPRIDVQEQLDEQGRQRERAALWVRDNWKNPAICIVCGSNNWQIGDVFELRAYHGGTLVLGSGPILPVFPVTCNVCGNTVFINAVRAGAVAVDNVEPAPEPDA